MRITKRERAMMNNGMSLKEARRTICDIRNGYKKARWEF